MRDFRKKLMNEPTPKTVSLLIDFFIPLFHISLIYSVKNGSKCEFCEFRTVLKITGWRYPY